MSTRLGKLVFIVATSSLLAITGCFDDTVDLGEPRSIECPAAPGSQTPNLAVGLDGDLYFSWIEPGDAGHAFRFAVWSEGGWSAPRTIAEGDNWFVNWADFPSMTALEDGTLAAHWLVKSGGETYAYDVYVALSQDGGINWSEPFRPHGDATQTEHGFVSLVPTAANNFGVVWLDGRYTGDTPRGPMTLRYATLLPDGGLRDEAQIDERVCDCCSTDAVRTGDGSVLVAYRDRTDSEIRDISVSRLEGSTWSSPRSVHADNWEIAACPVNGPAVAAQGDLVAVAWFTAAQDSASVLVAFSRDGGGTFGPPLQVDHGKPLGRVDLLLLENGTALVSWLEHDEGQARIVLRPVTPSGALPSTVVARTSQARSSGFPRMARIGNEVILAWTEAGDPSRIAMAALPM
jgi:hypothetical protein